MTAGLCRRISAFQPVDNGSVVNSVKAGAAVPVRFSLGGFRGLNVFADGYPRAQRMQCATGAPLATIEETVSAGSSALSYDQGTDRYTFVWKTDRAWAGSCRELQVLLSDGELHTARFSFAR